MQMFKRFGGQFKIEVQQNGMSTIYKKIDVWGDSSWSVHSTPSTESIAISLVDRMYQGYLNSRVVKIIE